MLQPPYFKDGFLRPGQYHWAVRPHPGIVTFVGRWSFWLALFFPIFTGIARAQSANVSGPASELGTPQGGVAGSSDQSPAVVTGHEWLFTNYVQGKWRFNPDGTMDSSVGLTGTWQIAGGAMTVTISDGSQVSFPLPINTAGAWGNSQGRDHSTELLPTVSKKPIPHGNGNPQPTAPRSAGNSSFASQLGTTAPGAAGSGDEFSAVLTKGEWGFSKFIKGKWRFNTDGTMSSDESGKGSWQISPGAMTVTFSDGSQESFPLPINPAGTWGKNGKHPVKLYQPDAAQPSSTAGGN
jgi:hypothetical protein